MVEETVPVQTIWIDTKENEDGVAAPFENETSGKLREHILICHEALLVHGDTMKEAWQMISDFPGFQTADARAIIGQLQEGQEN